MASSSSSWISAGLRTVADYFGEEEQEDENLTIVHESSTSPTTTTTTTNSTPVLAVESPDGSSKRKVIDATPSEEDFLVEQRLAFPEKKRLKETALNYGQQEEEKAEGVDAKLPANIDHADASSVGGNSDQSLEPLFQAKLDDLKAFIATHGHMNISHSNEQTRPLYSWIKMQRMRRKVFPKRYGSHRAMTPNELDALNAIGFDWTPIPSVVRPRSPPASAPAPERPTATAIPPKASGFWKKFEELKAFKLKHGHLNVKSTDKYVRLYTWMHKQRQLGKTFPLRYYKEKRAMTQEEKDALDSVGFVWDTRPAPAVESTAPSPDMFRKKLEELRAFRAKHGHLNVPYKGTDGKVNSLYKWVQMQRQLGKSFPRSRFKGRRAMTQEEKDALDSIGFVWEEAPAVTQPQPSATNPGSGFWMKLEELKVFKKKHGHVNVSFSSTDKAQGRLYKWIHAQRQRGRAFPKAFRKNGNGLRAMTQEEKNALDSIGFVWEPASSVQSVLQPQSSKRTKSAKDERSQSSKSKSAQAVTVQQSKSSKSTSTKNATVEQLQSSKSTSTKSVAVEQSQSPKKGAFWQNFDLLKEFKAKNGHVDVKYAHSKLGPTYHKLFKWVHMQRQLGSKFPARYYKEKRAMTQEEKDALDSIGFVWL